MLAFLLPALVSFVHSTEGHHHFDTCKLVGETHMHESKLDCDLGDLQMVKIGFYAFAKAYATKTSAISKKVDTEQIVIFSKSVETTSDRGPPAC